MNIEGLSLAQRYAHRVASLAAVEAIAQSNPDLSVIRATEIINLWLIDREDHLIEYATDLEQGEAELLYHPNFETFDLYAL